MPFLVQHNRLQVFVEAPAVLHIVTRQRERIISMVLPEVAAQDWKVPPTVAQTLPGFSTTTGMAVDLWQVLSCLGGFGLILEWLLFGRQRSLKFRPRAVSSPSSVSPPERQRELVA